MLYGDAGGEYMEMDRGRYSATGYVWIAFALEIFVLGALPSFLLSRFIPGTHAAVIGFIAGAALAWIVFRDRWRCIEAYASRACSGVVNLSLLYVPLVALIYANVRGVAKLRGR
jgi:hypothetical protein